MKLRALVVLAVLAVAGLAGGARAASEPFTLVEGGNVLFPDRAYVIALDQKRKLASGDVAVSENGQSIKDVTVDNAAAGVGTVLLIDASNSMKGSIGDAMAAARTFAARIQGAPVSVVTFNVRPRVVLPFTTNKKAIAAALAKNPKLAEGTRMWDALSAAQAQLGGTSLAAARIVLVSDGADVGSLTPKETVTKALTQDNIRVYSVGIASPAFKAQDLQAVAKSSGGTYALASQPAALRGIYDSLGTQAAKEYVMRYRSPAQPGKDVKVAVVVKGVGGPVNTSYTTPHIGSAVPFKPSIVDKLMQSWLLMLLVVALIIALICYAVAKLIETHRNRQLRRRLSEYDSFEQIQAEARQEEVERLMSQRKSSRLRFDDWDWVAKMEVELELAKIKRTPQNILIWTVIGTLVVAIVLGAILSPWWVLAAIAVPFLVRGYIHRRASKARDAFGEQLPDNLEVMASALRAGHSLVGAMAVVVEEAPDPSKEEFRRVVADEQLGIPLDETLELTARRMDNKDMEQVAVVALLQREAGGNMAEVLDRVIENIRGRQEVRRLVRTLTAQGRLSKWILSLLPIFVMLMILLLNPTYMEPLFHRLIGQVALVMASISVLIGFLIINKIVKIKV